MTAINAAAIFRWSLFADNQVKNGTIITYRVVMKAFLLAVVYLQTVSLELVGQAEEYSQDRAAEDRLAVRCEQIFMK